MSSSASKRTCSSYCWSSCCSRCCSSMSRSARHCAINNSTPASLVAAPSSSPTPGSVATVADESDEDDCRGAEWAADETEESASADRSSRRTWATAAGWFMRAWCNNLDRVARIRSTQRRSLLSVDRVFELTPVEWYFSSLELAKAMAKIKYAGER